MTYLILFIPASNDGSAVPLFETEISSEVNSLLPVNRNSVKTSTMDFYLLKENTTIAAIMWCLRTVRSHLSNRSSADCVVLFPKMFPDSKPNATTKINNLL